MIITKTPFRISFFGGGTDIETFFSKYGGSVLSTSFDKYCYVTVRHLPRFFPYRTHLTYSKVEYVNSYEEILHPLIRNAMKYLDVHDIRLTYDADLPARSGLGTSSSFAVGMLEAFYGLKNTYVDKKKLADDAIYVERTLCNEAGGWQDQIAASFGGLNRIDFFDGGYRVTPVIVPVSRKKELNNRLMLFFTGFVRFSSNVQKSNMTDEEKRIANLKKMLSLVDEGEKILVSQNLNLDEFGYLLDTEWKLKRGTGKNVSTPEIDVYYEKAIQAGALGGKLLGAGGGGFLLFYVPENKRQHVFYALKDLMYIPFEFESAGTSIVYYSADTYESRENDNESNNYGRRQGY